jgi:zinc transporter ZupT
MEGLGIGAADSFISQVSVVFAILIHKIFESIALAGLLAEGRVGYLQSRVMFGVFALATPIGAMCTALIQSHIEAGAVDGDISGKVLDGVVTALASGSFMSVLSSSLCLSPLNIQSNFLPSPLSVSLPLCPSVSAGILGRWKCFRIC